MSRPAPRAGTIRRSAVVKVSFDVMCIVEIRPGRGGQDAEEFAGSIARAISAWSGRRNQPASISDSGTRSITLVLPRTPVTALR